MDEEVKVSQLPEANQINNSDILMIIQNGTNKQVNADQLSNLPAINNKFAALNTIIAEEYDNTSTYTVGDYCIYNNTLYKCIISTPGPQDFAPVNWTAVLIGDKLESVEGTITSLGTNKADLSTTPQTNVSDTRINTINLGWNSTTNNYELVLNGIALGTNTDFTIPMTQTGGQEPFHRIYKTTVTGTPDNNGFIASGLIATDVVIGVTGSDGFFTPFIDGGNNRITIKCETWDRQPITTGVSLNVYWLVAF